MYSFNNEKKEISFDTHVKPTPWMNYLTNGTFHTMMSQAGGGVAFYKSPQIWRINHYRFFHLPTDRSGFYTYILDGDDYWCPTAEPCAKKPERWQGTHGMGYTRFKAKRGGVRAVATYFVGEYEDALIWNIKITSEKDKKIKLFPFVELAMMEFERELQGHCYTKHTVSVEREGETLLYKYAPYAAHPDTPIVYFATDTEITSFDGDRDEFVGAYRSEECPIAVEEGGCRGTMLFGGDPCFAFEIDIELKAGEEREVNIFLGAAKDRAEAVAAAQRCRAEGFVERSYSRLLEHWNEHLDRFKCTLNDKDAETMINIWNPYQAERNFLFSRNISFYATGTFRGIGIRDTAQDILSMVPFDTMRAREKLNLLLSQQYKDGHANHYCFPIEGFPPVTSIHSDDHLWFVMALYQIIMEEGKLDYLDERVEYYDGGSATVWEHIKGSIDYTMKNLGVNGLPLMLASDWNDMLNKVCREGRGESVWTAMQLGTVLPMARELATLKGEAECAARYAEIYEAQKKLVNTIAWDGGWYIRCIADDGRFYGSEKEPEAKIWLNSQSWSVLSGFAEGERGRICMDNVNRYLDTDLGLKKIHPSMSRDYPSAADPLTSYNKGCGENGSIFCHANTWAIIAECMLGNPERAYKYYRQLLPMVAQARAGEWRYKAEPYAYSSNIFGPESDKFGLANVSWLTGTATWMYIAATQYILGVRPRWEGIEIAPCLPDSQFPAHVSRTFRGCRYDITITKNGRAFIPHVEGRDRYEITI